MTGGVSSVVNKLLWSKYVDNSKRVTSFISVDGHAEENRT